MRPPPKVSTADVRTVVKRLRARTSSIMAEADRLGCYHATLRKQIRGVIGWEEYNRLLWDHRRAGGPPKQKRERFKAAPFVPDLRPMEGSTLCKRCQGETLAGTNGDGLAVLICLRCGGREVVFPRRVIAVP